MQTTELSLRAQTILEFLESVMTDLCLELRKTYEHVDIKLSVSAE